MSQLKLKHSGGNSVIIAAPSSNPAADRTLTLPGNADGTILTTGNSTLGKVLQVVQTTKTDQQTIVVSDGLVDIGNFNVNITPSATSSKILIHFTINVGGTDYLALNLVRGSTNIIQGNADGSNRMRCSIAANQAEAFNPRPHSFSYLDSPSSTGTLNYKITADLSNYSNSYTAFINRDKTYDDDNYTMLPASTLIAMEIGA